MPARLLEGLAELRGLVGQEVGVSAWYTVTQEQIDAFAQVSHDGQWIHTDPVRARSESPFGTAIAHGFLTLSLLSYLHGQAVQVQGGVRLAVNYGLNRVRFPAPVPAGARIRSHSTLQALQEIDGGVQVVWLISVESEGATKPALVAEWLVRFYT